MPLLPHIPFHPRETLLSFAGRLAAIHTGQGVHRLLADMNITVEDFTMGRETALTVFAGVTATDPAILLRSNMRATRSDVVFRGEQCQKTFLARAADKYCPICLADDGAPRDWKQRLIWCFAPAHRCGHHGVWLERLDAPARTFQEGLVAPDPAAATSAEGPRPAYLSWLKTRLHGDSGGETDWLAGQGIQQVLDASLMLGTVLVEGHKIAAKTLSAPRQEAALEAGFTYVARGPDGVTEALDQIRAASPAQAVQAGPLAHYGKLYDWLDRQCNARDPGPIRDLLRDHIIEHDAVDVGEVILAVEMTKRRFHSVQSLCDTLGVNRKRMSRLLQRLGRVPVGATDAETGLLRFHADEISTLLADFETAIPLAEVPDYIGASISQMRALYAAGLLEPLVPRDAPGAVRQVVFSRRSLEAFLELINALPEVDPALAEDLHSVSYACQRGAGTTAEVFRAVLLGELSAFRLPGKHGVASVLVSPDEALSCRAA